MARRGRRRGPLRRLYKVDRVKEGWLPEVAARLQVRSPSVPIVFCNTRPLAEQWTYWFPGAALAEFGATSTAPPER